MIQTLSLRRGPHVSRAPSDARRVDPFAERRGARRATKLAATTVLLVLLAGTDGAQALTGGPEIPVNTTTADLQFEPAIAPDGSGGFAVAWTSAGQDGSGYNVYARPFDAAGAPLGGEIAVNTTTAYEQKRPAIAPDGSGGFTVAWASELQDGSGWGVYARRFGAGGAALSGEIPVNTTVANRQFEPAIAPDGSGGFTVAWTSNYDIYARRFDAAGVPLSGEIPINSTTADYQFLHE